MPFTAVSWSDLRRRLRERLELKSFWTDEELLLAFNEALRFYNLLTGRWHKRDFLLTVANQYLYEIPASLLCAQRMEFAFQPTIAEQVGLPLTSSSLEDLTNARYQWRRETTISGGDVPTRPTVFAPLDLRHFLIWPADALDANTLLIDGIAITPILVADDDTLDLGEELINHLLGYALHTLAFKKGGPYFTDTQPLFRAFLAAAAEENDQIKTSQTFRRVMGWPHRDLRPLRGTPTQLDPIAQRTP